MRKDRILEYVLSHSLHTGAGPGVSPGVTAQEVADALGIWRSDACVELNKLVAEGRLARRGKKGVRFAAAATPAATPDLPDDAAAPATSYIHATETPDATPHGSPTAGEPESYMPPLAAMAPSPHAAVGSHLGESATGTGRAAPDRPPRLEGMDGAAPESTAFSKLIGAKGSLRHQIRVAKAAATYPPHGLNTLITGQTGAGKSLFAHTIWEFVNETRASGHGQGEIPFVHFNCAEYADNPQLLLSNLFGYKKGAFTGTYADQTGLVETADGGILFLDEIHCLSKTGQELFFTLLDTGFYRRIGDQTKRESHFMLIGATTKSVTDVLLDTFIRRMPVLIQLPSLAERPLSERQEFVERFFSDEANRIKRPLHVKKDVLNALMEYTLHANLGNLKNVIQISCAKGYMREMSQGALSGEITVSFSDLSFHAAKQSKSAYGNAQVFYDGDKLIPVGKMAEAGEIPPFIDIYDYVVQHMEMGLQRGLDSDELQRMIAYEVDNYYDDLDRTMLKSQTDAGLLNSIVFPGSVPLCAEFLAMAADELGRKYSANAPLLLAMHISQYVDRMRSEQPAFPADFRMIVKGYLKEAQFLRSTRAWLSEAFRVAITDDELAFLAIFLIQASDKANQPNPGIWITAVSGNGAASGMCEFANSVFGSGHVQWIDGRPHADDIFQKLCKLLKSFHGLRGNIILTDIEALAGMEHRIFESTGVTCRIIPVLERNLLFTACKETLASDGDIGEVYRRIVRSYCESINQLFASKGAGHAGRDLVIFTVCVTGVGSAMTIKEILEKRLSHIPDLSIVPLSSLEDIREKASAYGDSLKLIIGTVNPDVPDVPFMSSDRVFTANGLYCITTILIDWGQGAYQPSIRSEAPGDDELENILNESIGYIAPSVDQKAALSCIRHMVAVLEGSVYHHPLADDVKTRVFMHAAGMLERIANHRPLPLDEEYESLIGANINEYNALDAIITQCFVPCCYEIPRSEVLFFLFSLPKFVGDAGVRADAS
ncbi:MAG: sigma 54-interacting transcriptional regulator [Lachnospiraceae bacterium]|jgi:transcriptional regulator with AAA-type ATPase domain/transcriptional regulatory protein LevR|nr:sigma 54-interacting transcriptional regulator [Lachnospiraceae bacterium]